MLKCITISIEYNIRLLYGTGMFGLCECAVQSGRRSSWVSAPIDMILEMQGNWDRALYCISGIRSIGQESQEERLPECAIPWFPRAAPRGTRARARVRRAREPERNPDARSTQIAPCHTMSPCLGPPTRTQRPRRTTWARKGSGNALWGPGAPL